MFRLLLMLAVMSSGGVRKPPSDPTYFVILGTPDQFSSEFPPRSPESARQLGFGIVLFTLSTPVADLRCQVVAALNTSQKTGYPLLIHLDDWNFSPPSSDPNWVEWTGFPQPGEKHGPLVKRRWLNWGQWTDTGPPPDYESPTFKAFMRKQIEDGVVKPLAARLRQWRKEARAYLFAGLVVGWESGYYTMSSIPHPRPVSGKETFNNSEVVTTGYAALTHLGYTAKRLANEAKAEGITEQTLFRRLMIKVVHNYTEFLCRVCVRGGIPRNRIYTHYTPSSTVMSPAQIASDGRLLPVSTAVNPYSRPGYTMTHGWMNPDKVVSEIHKSGRRKWGAVEMEIVPGANTERACLEQFNWLASHGAMVLCLYGWGEPKGQMFAVRSTGAPAAIKRWLSAPLIAPGK